MVQQKEYLDTGILQALEEILSKHNPKSIFFVTGKNSYNLCGAEKMLEPIFEKYKHVRFSDFSVNPKLDDVLKGVSLFLERKCDFVVAIGGGTVLDIAKLVNIFSENKANPQDYILKKEQISVKGHPLAAIPTTAGSGSEATHFAVVYIDKTKYSLAHEYILPDYAVVDSSLMMSLPQKITAFTGMDALCQAIESYWNVKSTEESKNYASQAIKLIIENLEDAVLNNSDISKKAMALAAHLAGKAINISQTTACHAISYPITSYFGIPHGHAVGLTMPSMIVYNYGVSKDDVLDRRGAGYVKKTMEDFFEILGVGGAEEAGEKISELMSSIGLCTRLNELNITKNDIDMIVRNGFNPDRVKNNPRKITENCLRDMLEELL
ncbi:MAG: iron-containing alcohol dehydrogenase [Nanohaloarchaea archaeon]|nr:iron-containing alcohol dehydrogenase [Candidatus Nanohaloarchaea archaeon]